MIHVYTAPVCPRCKTLKAYLEREKEGCITSDLNTEAITDMRCEGYFGLSAPVLLIDGVYHGPEEIFDGDKLNEAKIRRLI